MERTCSRSTLRSDHGDSKRMSGNAEEHASIRRWFSRGRRSSHDLVDWCSVVSTAGPAVIAKRGRGRVKPHGFLRMINESTASASGRTLPALLHALPDLAPRPPRQPTRRNAEDEKRRNQARKRALFAAIRRDTAAGLSRRTIERKHNVGRRTIVKALTSATPPARKKINRQSAALHGLHHHIDAMIEANPTIPVKEVWEHLVDDHDAIVSYGATRAYVTKRKAQKTGRHIVLLSRDPRIHYHCFGNVGPR